MSLAKVKLPKSRQNRLLLLQNSLRPLKLFWRKLSWNQNLLENKKFFEELVALVIKLWLWVRSIKIYLVLPENWLCQLNLDLWFKCQNILIQLSTFWKIEGWTQVLQFLQKIRQHLRWVKLSFHSMLSKTQ